MTHLTALGIAGHASTASGRTLLVTALLLAGRALERLAERIALAEHRRAEHTEGRAEAPAAGREFHVVEQDGRHVGMLYEDGHLVALLPEIGRL